MADTRIEPLKFLFTVENITELKETFTFKFFLQIQWQIRLKKKEVDGTEVLAIYLHSLHKNKNDDWSIVARIVFKLMSNVYRKTHERTAFARPFTSRFTVWGFHSFIEWKDLFDKKNGFVTNDCSKFEVELETGPMQEESTDDIMKMVNLCNCCSLCRHGYFHMEISLHDSFLGVSSPKFMLRGFPWQILVLKTDSSKGLTLEVQLMNMTDKSIQNWECHVEATVNFISLIPRKSEKEKVTTLFNPAEIDRSLGLLKWDELHRPANKFIRNDTFRIEVYIKVENFKGLPPTIDETKCNIYKSEQLVCIICSEDFEDRPISITPCGHLFCTECIKRGLQRNKVCAICNHDVKLDELVPVFLPKKVCEENLNVQKT